MLHFDEDTTETFRAERRDSLSGVIGVVRPQVQQSLDQSDFSELTSLLSEIFWRFAANVDDSITPDRDNALYQDFLGSLTTSLAQTRQTQPGSDARETQVGAISDWVSIMAINAGLEAAAVANRDQVVLEWASMEDEDVRRTHVQADGERRNAGDPFILDGYEFAYPGQPVGPPRLWLRCRCTLRARRRGAVTAAGQEGTLPPAASDEPPNDFDISTLEPTQWNGVLALEGMPTGDRRMLIENSIRWRGLPIPLRLVREDTGGHNGAITVGRIDDIWRDGNLLRAQGTFKDSEDASETIGDIAGHFLRGVSVDLDDITLAPADPDSGMDEMEGRIAAATLVAIPAFAQSYVTLGPYADEPEVKAAREADESEMASFAISEKEWDGDASRFTLQQWCDATIISLEEGCESKNDHKLPIREPNGDLSRAGVHAAAARINQTHAPDDKIAAAKKKLRAAYSDLGEEPPEVVQAAEEAVETLADESGRGGEFVELPPDVGIPGERGRGWITNTKDTSTLWQYWTDPGQPGYAKIGWGTPNDFYRCRRELAKYIEPQYLNQTCAEWHHDALGVWPGQHAAADGSLTVDAIVAAATFETEPPREWFENPGLLANDPQMTVEDSGRIYGRIATWGVCHIGIQDQCTTAPSSDNDYAYFQTGQVKTQDGMVSVGTLSMGGGHASLNAGYRPAVEHYDSTSSAVAYVHVGEDDYGIWFAGMTAPGLTRDQLTALRASGTISGDWRGIGTSSTPDLVAALVVNVGGFPIPRPAIAASGGVVRSMVGITAAPEAAEESINQRVRKALRAERARERFNSQRVKKVRDVFDRKAQ